MTMKIILFGAGDIGRQALNFYGIRNVYCFVDNFKFGNSVCGKKVISFDELLKINSYYDVVISNETAHEEIAAQLKEMGIKFKYYVDDFFDFQKKNRPCNEEILKIKGGHKGEKIVLIGNGPSLKVADLEMIQQSGFKTMACNFINKLFDKVAWRPDYYCCVEESAIALNRDFIVEYPGIKKFIRGNFANDYGFHNDENLLLFTQNKKCEISEELEYIVNDYNTVMFVMIQFAIYMGFSEIFLLGVDNTQPPSVHTADFISAQTHFYEEESEALETRRAIMGHLSFENDYQTYQDHCNDGYACAKAYADANNIMICNATRGGRLEVFKRADIEKLLV